MYKRQASLQSFDLGFFIFDLGNPLNSTKLKRCYISFKSNWCGRSCFSAIDRWRVIVKLPRIDSSFHSVQSASPLVVMKVTDQFSSHTITEILTMLDNHRFEYLKNKKVETTFELLSIVFSCQLQNYIQNQLLIKQFHQYEKTKIVCNLEKYRMHQKFLTVLKLNNMVLPLVLIMNMVNFVCKLWISGNASEKITYQKIRWMGLSLIHI